MATPSPTPYSRAIDGLSSAQGSYVHGPLCTMCSCVYIYIYVLTYLYVLTYVPSLFRLNDRSYLRTMCGVSWLPLGAQRLSMNDSGWGEVAQNQLSCSYV